MGNALDSGGTQPLREPAERLAHTRLGSGAPHDVQGRVHQSTFPVLGFRPEPDPDPGKRAVAEDVGLAEQAGRIVLLREVPFPLDGEVVATGRLLLPGAQLLHVVRTAGLRSRSDRGPLPPAEGLPLHDRPGDRPIHIGVAHLHPLHPALDLTRIKGVDPTGQAELARIHELDRSIEIGYVDQPEHGAEALRAMEPGAGLDLVAHSGAPQVVAEIPGLHQPTFAGIERGERTVESIVGRTDQRTHRRLDRSRRAELDALHRIDELSTEPIRPTDVAHQNRKARRRTLLSAVSERRLHEVGHRQVEVGVRRDDQGILA